MRLIAWLDLSSLHLLERIVAERFLRKPSPPGLGDPGRSIEETLAAAEVTAAAYFNLECADDKESWGILATSRLGAIVVPAELAKAATLPALPQDLWWMAQKVGPTNDQLRRAIRDAERDPKNVERRRPVIAAALEHALMQQRLSEWRPARRRALVTTN